MHRIGILGCGWLGLSLAINLKNQEYSVCGSRTSSKGIIELEREGIKGFKVILNDNKHEGLETFINSISTLIISLPPKKSLNIQSYFV